ncbi:MAG: APC family permease [Candidatus Marsarchaeota archaeon]|nr:APC family permease [Candidatus Marsarchaeota archaeon]
MSKTKGLVSLARGSVDDLPRRLSAKDAFFMAFGGQSPFLSLFTYGVAVISVARLFSPVAMVLGTVLVLFNGLVVYRLSTRFTMTGGYYAYALHSLSQRFGFQTGWMYLFYSVLYGCAYVVGVSYVLNQLIGVPPVYTAIGVLLPATFIVFKGVKISSRFAVIAGSLELAVISALIFAMLSITHFHLYDPLRFGSQVTPGRLGLAVLFASAIPTGFGSLTPVSGEVVNARKVVGKTVLAVISTGGLLASVFIYSFLNAGLHMSSPSDLLSVGWFTQNIGGALAPVLLVAFLNDGVLAVTAFMTASSRTLFKMASDNAFPHGLAGTRAGHPIKAITAVAIPYFLVSVILSVTLPAFDAFVALGVITGISSLLIHLAANASLIRLSLGSVRSSATFYVRSLSRSIGESVVGIAAAAISLTDLIYSIGSAAPIYVYVAFAWLIAGYLYGDIKEILFNENVEYEGGAVG